MERRKPQRPYSPSGFNYGGQPNNAPRSGERQRSAFKTKSNFKPKKVKTPFIPNTTPITSELQITDGKFRGNLLQNSVAEKAAATSRKLREAAFKLIGRRVYLARFLDLCAGSGMLGIEALSRGAMLGTFVERSSKMCSFIKKNLAVNGVKAGHGEIVEIEMLPFLNNAAKRRRFWEIVYFDATNIAERDEILTMLSRGTGVKKGGHLFVEHAADDAPGDKIGSLRRLRLVTDGGKAISFYERR